MMCIDYGMMQIQLKHPWDVAIRSLMSMVLKTGTVEEQKKCPVPRLFTVFTGPVEGPVFKTMVMSHNAALNIIKVNP